MSRTYADRKFNRRVKAMRRIREDRAEHGGRQVAPQSILCDCFDKDVDRGKGQTFARFADHPKTCSRSCCGNPRKHFGEVTRQEKRAPRVEDWS